MDPEGSLLLLPVPVLNQIYPVHAPPPFHFLEIHLNIIIHLHLGLPIGFLPSVFPTVTMYTSILAYISATWPAYLILLVLISRIIFCEEYRTLRSSLRNFLHSPVTPSRLGPNILLGSLFSNTLSLHSSLNVSDHVSHPYKITGKITVLYILIFIFLDSKLENKIYFTE